jgi:hypothetical protein
MHNELLKRRIGVCKASMSQVGLQQFRTRAGIALWYRRRNSREAILETDLTATTEALAELTDAELQAMIPA